MIIMGKSRFSYLIPLCACSSARLGFIFANSLHRKQPPPQAATFLLMKMRGIRKMICKLFLGQRKSNRSYVSLRSQPQSFPQLIRDHSNSEEGFVCAEGCFSVDVGKERVRFSVPISCLNHPLICALMERSAEEFGMDQTGVLTIPCDVQSFQHVLWLVHSDPHPSDETIAEAVKYYGLISQSYLVEEAESRR